MNLAQLQKEVIAWSQRNFPRNKPYYPLLGTVEEVSELVAANGGTAHALELIRALGRLAHAHLKSDQGIRGSRAKHHSDKVDAIGDIVIYLADYCARNGIDFEHAVVSTWVQVSQRNWQENREDGRADYGSVKDRIIAYSKRVSKFTVDDLQRKFDALGKVPRLSLVSNLRSLSRPGGPLVLVKRGSLGSQGTPAVYKMRKG